MPDTRDPMAALPPVSPWGYFLGFVWRDHAFVRFVYPNWHKVDDELYRTAHPSPRRLRIAKRRGIRSVLSLRGDMLNTPNLIERRAAVEIGLPVQAVRMRTVSLPDAATLLKLIDLLRTMAKPMLVHCKSGSDRTGLAVTLYLHVIKGQPLDEARRALSWKYGHWSFGSAGVVHRLLDAYAAAHAATGIGFEDWVRQDYDAVALMTDPD
ncbi:MAG: tyrosine-protein phosphatase [Rhodobacteraceae bacterium]|nr:tyrosine-protein phosphatase [Paracoccaceae bacterium]